TAAHRHARVARLGGRRGCTEKTSGRVVEAMSDLGFEYNCRCRMWTLLVKNRAGRQQELTSAMAVESGDRVRTRKGWLTFSAVVRGPDATLTGAPCAGWDRFADPEPGGASWPMVPTPWGR